MHLVGFIIGIYHDARSPERRKSNSKSPPTDSFRTSPSYCTNQTNVVQPSAEHHGSGRTDDQVIRHDEAMYDHISWNFSTVYFFYKGNSKSKVPCCKPTKYSCTELASMGSPPYSSNSSSRKTYLRRAPLRMNDNKHKLHTHMGSTLILLQHYEEHAEVSAVAQWLRCCATKWMVAGSIPADVIGIFHRHKILPIAPRPWGRLSL